MTTAPAADTSMAGLGVVCSKAEGGVRKAGRR